MLGHQPFSEFGFSDISITYNNYTWPVFTLYIQEETAIAGDISSQIVETLEIDTSLLEVI